MKKIAMIPALLGSSRIPDKNLIFVDGFPMVFYTARACRESGIFDEIYINSEDLIFEKMASMLGVKFYRRPANRGGSRCMLKSRSRQCAGDRCTINDHFLFDFMEKFEDSLVALVNTTSPLLEPETIRKFMAAVEENGNDSFFSVEERYAETFYNGCPLNFSLARKQPSQSLRPLQIITWAISAWRTSSFLRCYRSDHPDEKAPVFNGNIGMFSIDRIQGLDADTWDDFYLIEASLQRRKRQQSLATHRFSESITEIENDLKHACESNGIRKFESSAVNSRLSNLDEIKRRLGKESWAYLLIHSSNDQVLLICQRPGEGTRKHSHVTSDQWWLVIEGRFEWRLDNDRTITAAEGDIVFLPNGASHTIVCTSEIPGIRLSCGGRDMEYIYAD